MSQDEPQRCQCHQEIGDSPCPIHGLDEDDTWWVHVVGTDDMIPCAGFPRALAEQADHNTSAQLIESRRESSLLPRTWANIVSPDQMRSRGHEFDPVMVAIQEEISFQDRKWGSPSEHPHEVAGWILLIGKFNRLAGEAWCSDLGDAGALDAMRKVAALAIQCLRQHGCPRRAMPPDLLTDDEVQADWQKLLGKLTTPPDSDPPKT